MTVPSVAMTAGLSSTCRGDGFSMTAGSVMSVAKQRPSGPIFDTVGPGKREWRVVPGGAASGGGSPTASGEAKQEHHRSAAGVCVVWGGRCLRVWTAVIISAQPNA